MEKLVFDAGVFEEGPGRNYRKVMNIALPGLFVGAVLIAVINAGLFTGEIRGPLQYVYLLAAVYAVAGIFAFPTAWFLRSGKTRLLKESWLEVGRKEIVYHRAVAMTVGRPRFEEWHVTGIRRGEEQPKQYVIHGSAVERTSGRKTDSLLIPRAFADMERMVQAARYKNR